MNRPHLRFAWSAVLLFLATQNPLGYIEYPVALVEAATVRPQGVPSASDSTIFWQLLPAPAPEGISQIDFIRADKGWVLTASGQFFEYDGEGWHDIMPPTDDPVSTFFVVSEEDIWCATYDYVRFVYFIWHFRNNRWSEPLPVPERVLDFAFTSSEAGWASGENGLILRYDGGRWEPVPSPTLLHLRSVVTISPSDAWAVGEYRGRGCIIRFDGTRWSDVTPFPVDELLGLVLFSADSGWAAGGKELLRYQVGRWSRVTEQEAWNYTEPTGRITCLDRLPWGEVMASLGPNRFFVTESGRWRPLRVPAGLEAVAALPYPSGKRFVGITTRQTEHTKQQPISVDGRGAPLFSRNPFTKQLHIFGVAVADLDNDRLVDVYLINTERENALLHQEGPVQFINRAEDANLLAPVHDGKGINFYDSGVVVGDVDNDGHSDLFLSSLFLENKLYRNLGRLRFRDVTKRAGVGGEAYARSNSAAFADADNDGDLDLFVTNLHGSNRLYLNNGTGRFEDRTTEAGLETVRGGVGATFGDLDNDGDADLFVATWSGPNLLYENLGPDPHTGVPRFVESAERRGVIDPVTGKRSQGAVFGDIDNDGDLDLFVTSVVTTNRLYRNDGRGYFADITVESGVADSGRSNSASFFDADNDGDLDLFVANKGPNALYLNRGDGVFDKITGTYLFGPEAFSVGTAVADLDGDGDVDLVVANYDIDSAWLRNEHDRINRSDFLRVRLLGVISNRDAIGARVYLYPAGHAGDVNQLLGMREVCAGSGYYSMSSTEIHFGVDPSKRYDLRIRFPSGVSRLLRNVVPGQLLTVEELEGFTAQRIRLLQWLRRATHNPKNQQTLAEITSLLLMLGLLHLWLRRQPWWRGRPLWNLYLPPLAAYVAVSVMLHDREGILVTAGTYGITLAAFGWTIHSARRARWSQATEGYREDLLLACSAFDHGEWLAKSLTRLQFLFGNLQPEAAASRTVSDRVLAAIGDFDLVAKELRHITSLAERAGLRDAASVLSHHQIRLDEHVAEAKVLVSLQRSISKKIIDEVPRLVEGIREHLRQIRSQVGSSLYGRLAPTLERLKNHSGQEFGIDMEIDPWPVPDLWLKIRTPELTTILEDLLSNAAAAVTGRDREEIRIVVSTEPNTVILDFSDSGPGIPEELWERIFDPGFSTRGGDHAGFGLYYARKILSRYGGSIRVKSSTPDEGTTFEIRLRRFGHE